MMHYNINSCLFSTSITLSNAIHWLNMQQYLATAAEHTPADCVRYTQASAKNVWDVPHLDAFAVEMCYIFT
jgi:hypothetical protein